MTANLKETINLRIVELYQNDVSIREIVNIVHLSDTYIRETLKKKGVFVSKYIPALGIQAEIEKLIRSGMDKKDVAEKICSTTTHNKQTVMKYCRQAEKKVAFEKLKGYKYFQHKNKEEHAQALYEQGVSLAMIARITGISRGTLYRKTKKHDWKRIIILNDKNKPTIKCSVCGKRLGNSTVRYVGYDAQIDEYYSEYVCSAFCLEELEAVDE